MKKSKIFLLVVCFLCVRQILNSVVKVGWEYLEIEWNYKGVKYKSIAIVTNEDRGLFFDQIFSMVGGISTSITVTQ